MSGHIATADDNAVVTALTEVKLLIELRRAELVINGLTADGWLELASALANAATLCQQMVVRKDAPAPPG